MNIARSFVSASPWTEEEMHDVSREIQRRATPKDAAQSLEQLAQILRARAQRIRNPRPPHHPV